MSEVPEDEFAIDREARYWALKEAAELSDPAETAARHRWREAHPRHELAYLKAKAILNSVSRLEHLRGKTQLRCDSDYPDAKQTQRT